MNYLVLTIAVGIFGQVQFKEKETGAYDVTVESSKLKTIKLDDAGRVILGADSKPIVTEIDTIEITKELYRGEEPQPVKVYTGPTDRLRLLTYPPVVEELELKSDQVNRLKKAISETNSLRSGPKNRLEVNEFKAQVNQLVNVVIEETLNNSQLNRFSQIELQAKIYNLGLVAFHNRELMKSLKIDSTQERLIADSANEFRRELRDEIKKLYLQLFQKRLNELLSEKQRLEYLRMRGPELDELLFWAAESPSK